MSYWKAQRKATPRSLVSIDDVRAATAFSGG
jgi:hypothetical protein